MTVKKYNIITLIHNSSEAKFQFEPQMFCTLYFRKDFSYLSHIKSQVGKLINSDTSVKGPRVAPREMYKLLGDEKETGLGLYFAKGRLKNALSFGAVRTGSLKRSY